MSASFERIATETFTAERATLAAGVRGDFAAHLGGAATACTPIAPVDAETVRHLELDTPTRKWQICVDGGVDVAAGDRLTISGATYRVVAVAPYYWRPAGATRLQVFLEEARV